jgi:hypothetical protein
VVAPPSPTWPLCKDLVVDHSFHDNADALIVVSVFCSRDASSLSARLVVVVLVRFVDCTVVPTPSVCCCCCCCCLVGIQWLLDRAAAALGAAGELATLRIGDDDDDEPIQLVERKSLI